MISKLVTQRSGEALVRLSFFQRVVFWCQKKKKEKLLLWSWEDKLLLCVFRRNPEQSQDGSGDESWVISGNTWTSSSGSEAHCFATVLNSRFVSFSTFMLKLANVILRWLDKNTTKNKKNTKVCLYQRALCCAVGLNCVLWVSARRLERVSSASHRGRWQKAVNFSSFIHFFCSTVFDVLFSIYLQLYWQCKCTSCDSDAGDQVQKLLSVVWKRNAELLNLLHVVEQVWSNDHAGDGNIVVWQKKQKKNGLTTMLIMFWFPSF